LSSDLSKDVESVLNLHWAEKLSALPNEESSVIVIGRVVELNAHLSPSKHTVYSEINIEIEEILKNAPDSNTAWTMQMLADKLVEMKVVASISDECVRERLKKVTSSRGSNGSGVLAS